MRARATVVWVAYLILAAGLALYALAQWLSALANRIPVMYGEGAVANAARLARDGIAYLDPDPSRFVAANYPPLYFHLASIVDPFITGRAASMAATFTASEVSPDLSRSVSISSLGIAGIITVTLLVLVFTMLSSHAQALQVALAQAKMEFALVAGSANLAEPAHLLPRRGFDPTSVQFKRLVAPHVFVWKLSRGGSNPTRWSEPAI